jgi:predicted glutamine amidotransferase
MCRLFGFRSSVESSAHRSLVAAENAMVTQATYNPHGWGIGYFVGRDAYILKSDDAAHTSERFRLASSRLRSQTFVVHVRRATVGVTDYLNSHPFRFGRWVFAHNGTVFDFDKLRGWMLSWIPERRRALILGNTDSEHTFHYLISALERAGFDAHGHEPLERMAEAAEVLHTAVDAIFEKAREVGAEDHPILNFILTDGEAMFAQRAGKELYFATQKYSCNDFETCPEPNKFCMLAARPEAPVNHLIVSSERIGEEDRWEAIEQGHMVYMGRDFRVGHVGKLPNYRASKLAE